jgi:hypothetical protein
VSGVIVEAHSIRVCATLKSLPSAKWAAAVVVATVMRRICAAVVSQVCRPHPAARVASGRHCPSLRG